MPKLREELQFTSLDEQEIIRPKEGVSLYYKNGVMKILHASGDEQTLLSGEGLNIDLSQYYTKQEVDELLEALGPTGFEVIEVEVLPTIGEAGKLYITPVNDGSYLEYLYVNNKWELVGGQNADLTNYYTKSEIDSKLDNLDIPETDLKNYALKSELPTKTSDLTNDSGFLTEHQSLEGYATEEFVAQEVSTLIGAAPEAYDTLKEIADYIESDLTNTSAMLADIASKANSADVYSKTEANGKFATKEEIPTLPDMTQYYTKTETEGVIDNKIKDISGIDLENYYNKTEIDTITTTINATKQDTLISGTNIKTINGESILGSGDIQVAAEGGSDVIANPELDGGEEILESIQIEDVKYSLQGQDMTFSESISEDPEAKILKTITIGTDDWKVDKGSVVRPNVELSGDEEVLESVQIDDAIFTLKGEEMIFSENAVEGATVLKNIQLGEDNWAIVGEEGGSSVIPNPDLTGDEEALESVSIDGINYSILGSDITFSETSKEGYALKSITVGNTVWSVEGGSNVDLTGYATESYVDTKVAGLVNSAPETLDTLGELATALQENESVVEALNTSITNKLDKTMIVYSETEPENPTTGMIWLKKI